MVEIEELSLYFFKAIHTDKLWNGLLDLLSISSGWELTLNVEINANPPGKASGLRFTANAKNTKLFSLWFALLILSTFKIFILHLQHSFRTLLWFTLSLKQIINLMYYFEDPLGRFLLYFSWFQSKNKTRGQNCPWYARKSLRRCY